MFWVLNVGSCLVNHRGGKIRIGTVAADRDGGGLPGTPVERIHRACLGAVTCVSSGDSQRKVEHFASIQREIADRALLDDFAERRVLCFQRLNGGGYRQRVVLFTDGQRKIETLCAGRLRW